MHFGTYSRAIQATCAALDVMSKVPPDAPEDVDELQEKHEEDQSATMKIGRNC